MASGYIGKISAVVTANTADLSKKLRSSTQEWNSYGASLNRSLQKTAAGAASSIDRILTPLQRLEKQLKAATSSPLNIRTEDQANQIRRLTSAAVQINQPLEAAAGSFQKLSSEVQAGFAPALGRAQNQAQALFKILEVGRAPSEKYFEVVQNRVDRTTQALQRLTQAQQIASRGFTGNELQFANPAVFESLNRSATLSRQAGGLSADALSSGDVGNRVSRLNSLSQSISAAFARLESIRISPDVDTSQVERAEKELASLLATARSVQDGLQSTIQVQENIGASTAFMSTRDPSGRPLQERFALQQAIKNSRELERQVVEEIRDAEAKAAVQTAARREVASSLLNVLQQESAILSRQGEASSRDASGRSLQERFALQQRIREQEARQIELATAFNEALSQAKSLDQARLELASKRLNVLQRESDLLANQGAASNRDATGRSIQNRLIDIDFQRQQRESQQIASQRSAQSKALINATGGVGIANLNASFDQSAIRGYTAQLQTLQQTIASVSKEARGPAIGAFNRLRAAIAEAMNKGELETEQTRAKIKQLTAEAVSAASKVSGVSQRALGTRLQRAGSIATGAFGNASLAIQQAAFAVDDFFSVTGGLDQRIRASGNNLSQLGFIIGGTTGLIAGISASIGSQLVVAFLKWINAIEDTEEAQKRLDARLSSLNSSLDGQKSSVEALADAYESLGDSASNAFSDTLRLANANRDEIDRITRLQRERIEADAANVDPTIIARQAEIALIDRQLREEGDVARRRELLRQQENAQESVAFRRSVISGAAGRLSRQLTADQLAEEVRQATAAADDVRNRTFQDTPQGRDLRRSSLRSADERLAVARAAQLIESDSVARAATSVFQQIRDALSTIQQRASGIEGSDAVSNAIETRASEAANLLEQALTGNRDALRALRDAAEGVDEFARRADTALNRVEEASRAEEELKSSIERGRQLLLGESGRRAEQIGASIGDIRNAGGGQRQIALFLAEQARQIAPAVFALREQIANAAASGPNRAQLNASDIRNQQGASELNRLLRRDDSARYQNLAELRSQTAELRGLRDDIKNIGVAD